MFRENILISDTPENRLYCSPFVNFTNDRSVLCEKTLLEIYLKKKLNCFEINRNLEGWMNAKNELGRSLFKNDEDIKDLQFFKHWFGISFLTNIALGTIAILFYKKK